MSDVGLLDQPLTAPARPRDDGSKRQQIIDGARDVILRHGFDAASMNEIARVAGVSKGTLYVYFASKEELFEALIRDEKRAQAEQMCRFEEDGADIRRALSRFGARLLDLILRPASIAHLRTVAAVSAKFPQIGRTFYEAGPHYGIVRLATYLRSQADLGTVEIVDVELAASQFIELCKAFHLTRAIFCVGDPPNEAQIETHVANAVDVFMRAYGALAAS